jgi:hypothetical protein
MVIYKPCHEINFGIITIIPFKPNNFILATNRQLGFKTKVLITFIYVEISIRTLMA